MTDRPHDCSTAVPDFDWFKGHSGVLLSSGQAKALERVWREYIGRNRELIKGSVIGRNSDEVNFFTRPKLK